MTYCYKFDNILSGAKLNEENYLKRLGKQVSLKCCKFLVSFFLDLFEKLLNTLVPVKNEKQQTVQRKKIGYLKILKIINTKQ